MSGGLRYNKGKVDMSLMPIEYFSINISDSVSQKISYDLCHWFTTGTNEFALHDILNNLRKVHSIGALEISEVLNNGLKKYDARNWEKGMSWVTCYVSAQRHLDKMNKLGSKAIDDESKLKHIAHVACNIMFLLVYSTRFPELDDRPKQEEKK